MSTRYERDVTAITLCWCGHAKLDHTPDPVRDYRAESCDRCDCGDFWPAPDREGSDE